MNYKQMHEAMESLNEWKLITSFTVGGFDYLGFSRNNPHKLLIISGQKDTVFDCKDKSITEAVIAIDEKEFVALCDLLPDEEIPIAGSYGGSISHKTKQGERVEIINHDPHVLSGKELIYQKIDFIERNGNRTTIFDSYPAYVFGFSCDGNYFVLADDGALWILKRK